MQHMERTHKQCTLMLGCLIESIDSASTPQTPSNRFKPLSQRGIGKLQLLEELHKETVSHWNDVPLANYLLPECAHDFGCSGWQEGQQQ